MNKEVLYHLYKSTRIYPKRLSWAQGKRESHLSANLTFGTCHDSVIFVQAGVLGTQNWWQFMSPKPGRKNDHQNLAKAENSTPAEHRTDTTIGAAAGGIEAVTEPINYLQADAGLVFVLVQHLDPKHHSILTELLARKTAMTVAEVSEGLPVKPHHVYVIPRNATMSISDQTLHLSPRQESGVMHMSLLKMAREGLLVEMRKALTRAKKDNAIVKKRNRRIKNGNANSAKLETTESTRLVNFHVVPITLGNMKELYFMMLLRQSKTKPSVPIPSQCASSGSGIIESEPSSHPKSPNGSKLSACCPSPREREVLHFLADGKSNKEIGSILDISTRTVECYRARIMLKLHLHSTAALVRYAIRNKIVEA